MEECDSRGKLKKIGVYDETGICCGALFLVDGGRAIFLFSGQNDRGLESRAMFFLIDNFIKR
jgi:hypothetical protein